MLDHEGSVMSLEELVNIIDPGQMEDPKEGERGQGR